jgi:hypothetical protein
VNKLKRVLLRIGISILAVVVIVPLAVLLWFKVIIPTSIRNTAFNNLEDALRGARSVTIVEFVPAMDDIVVDLNLGGSKLANHDTVLQSVTASPEQIQQFRRTLGGVVDYGRSGRFQCFDPHHRVEIVRADGTTLRFEVCFLCRGFRFDKNMQRPLSNWWSARLARFFTTVGMPPRTFDEYVKLARARRPAENGNQ